MNFTQWKKSARDLALKYGDLSMIIDTRLPVLILDRNFEEGMQEQPLGPAEQVFKDRKSYLTYYGGDTWFIQYDIIK